MTRPSFAATLTAILLAATAAAGQTLEPLRSIETRGDFAGKKRGKPARDISGMACQPATGDSRRCLLINDEGTSAQNATLTPEGLVPGAPVALIGDAPPKDAVGRQPTGLCGAPGRYGEFDGEGVAYAAPYFYVAGSHGCSRKGGEFRASSFLLARIGTEGAAPVTLSWRVSDMLARAGEAAPFFGRDLMGANGLNIEGIAVTGERAWLGLRAPSQGGRAFLVGADLASLFAAGDSPASPPLTVAFQAGEGRGIRDLAALADGRLLALVGPAQEQDLPYALILLDPARPDLARELGTLPRRGKAKAESLTILVEAAEGLTVLIGHDGPKNGAFEEYRLPLH